MQEFTKHQKRLLLKNSYVLKVTKKNVFYTGEFKLRALDMYFEGISPREIFEQCKIPSSFFPEGYFHHCLKRWKIKSDKDGRDSLKTRKVRLDNPGRPRKHLDDLGVDDLKSIIAVQEEFIAKIKKKIALAKKN